MSDGTRRHCSRCSLSSRCSRCARPAGRLHGAGVHASDRHFARRARPLPGHGRRPRRRPDVVGPTCAACWPSRSSASCSCTRSSACSSTCCCRWASRARQGGPGLEHGGVVRHEHELAVVLRRVDDGLPGPDGRPGGAELRVGRRRHRRRRRAGPRLHALTHRPARQLLGRPDPRLACGSCCRSPFVVRDRADRRRRDPELPRVRRRHARSPDGHQTLTGGPVASQEAIKELGTNGGGFYNANSAHPFENPTAWTNLLEIFLLLVDPVLACRARSASSSATSARATRSSPRWRSSGSRRSVALTAFELQHHGAAPHGGRRGDGGQGGPLRRAGVGAVRRVDDADVDGCGQQLPRQLHAARRRRRRSST